MAVVNGVLLWRAVNEECGLKPGANVNVLNYDLHSRHASRPGLLLSESE